MQYFSRASGAIKTALRRENGGEYLAAKIGTLFVQQAIL